jgi:hypothetical protein
MASSAGGWHLVVLGSALIHTFPVSVMSRKSARIVIDLMDDVHHGRGFHVREHVQLTAIEPHTTTVLTYVDADAMKHTLP